MFKVFVLFVLACASAQSDDEPFSIGLGVLSPSYSQNVGKENVKVTFNQKDDGFSYSIGDPKSGTNTYLKFGAGAAQVPAYQPAGYNAPNVGYRAPGSVPAANPAQYGQGGYAVPSGYLEAPSYGSGVYNAPSQGPANSGYYGETARKPQGGQGDILPAGFSYHGTEGQAFLRDDGESPNFMVSEGEETARGPAEQSFYGNSKSQTFLPNGLVGYGSAGPYGASALQRQQHGGHTSEDMSPYTG
ncbi:uncharacterized protein LOC129231458 [Uloborus diversus]|uniref:uncharacterized protein LOC129231458 n=1 Tax=Uloborus diversus TaxID=327109 RepID=UPI002409D734|nr:uncharacterized protein LOC129231458 [Uloborus diversus]